jgi:transcriptional regulator with XRE-family HTH domain
VLSVEKEGSFFMLNKSRVVKQITQKNICDIALDVNIGKSYLSDILNGRRQPSISVCKELQRVTRIHYLYFLLPPRESSLFLIKV